MENKEELKNIEWKITDEDGNVVGDLDLISLVFNPAIEKNAGFFSKDNKFNFAVVNEEEQIIVGPAMIPNKKILRQDEKSGEYFTVFFSEDTVKQCRNIFFKNSNHVKMNLEHGEVASKNQIKDVYAVMSWVVKDPEKDTSLAYGFKPEKGDWFVGYKVESPSLWASIKEIGLNGFSIEGNFVNAFSKMAQVSNDSDVEEIIKKIVDSDDLSDSKKEEIIKNLIK